jgi:uncharacterized PurR-regulated membrane protein YhhQ (DUF165 family)
MLNQCLWYKKVSCTLYYIVGIVFVNAAFSVAPYFTVGGCKVSAADLIVGIIYIVRDFAQREIGHYVIIAMLVACAISYCLAEQDVALASVSAFFVGEAIEWAIFTWSKQPLSKRLLWSSCLSLPLDSAIFLALLGMLNLLGFMALNAGKLLGVFIVWYCWRHKNTRQPSVIMQA